MRGTRQARTLGVLDDWGMVRRTVLFSGRVQGVGFRYTTCDLARRYAVTGFVRNLPDGRVEAVVEGEADQIERFLSAVRAEMAGHIERVRERQAAATGEYGRFDVRF